MATSTFNKLALGADTHRHSLKPRKAIRQKNKRYKLRVIDLRKISRKTVFISHLNKFYAFSKSFKSLCFKIIYTRDFMLFEVNNCIK
ncbi:MAG: hypothetical protein CVT96_03065 [Bacteroidetes bacterium HGW-Bacteroidetes-13]|nr:MAG: hypothetical protein CVT96_03065 [Bacteroidetes bacterium HGW-Bacteroidetes-13]